MATGTSVTTKPKPKKQTASQLSQSSVVAPPVFGASNPSVASPFTQVGGANNVGSPSLASLGAGTPTTGSPAIQPSGGFNAANSTAGNTVPGAAVQAASAIGNGGAQGWNQGTTDPLTGFLAQFGYTPAGAGQLYDNPMPLATDILGMQGINNPGMANSLSQYMDPAIAANFLIGKGMGSSSGDNAALNFAAQYMSQMNTPGGRTPEFDYLMNHLLGAGDPSSSPLAEYLSSGQMTPDQQVAAANALMSQTMVGLNPYAQRAYSNAGKDMGQAYIGNTMKGDPNAQSYVDYLKNKTPLGSWVNR